MVRACNSTMKDLEVIHTYLENQASNCFNLLYHRYATKIYSKCIAMLKNEEQAADATQDIFMKIFLNLSKFGEKSKFSTWVYSITYNYCIDFIRRNKKLSNIFSDEIENMPEIEDEVIDKELLEIEIDVLYKVLKELPPGDEAVLLMKYRDDMQIKEIAEILDKTESAIKMKLKRAKLKAQEIKGELNRET